MVAESIPLKDQALWGDLEHTGNMDWQRIPWRQNGMACIRSGYSTTMETVMSKAIESAKNGIQILLLLEYGEDEKIHQTKTGTMSIPVEDRDCVRVQHVISYPSGTLMWTDSCGWSGEWTQDATGVFQACEDEGKAEKQRSIQGKAVGFNAKRVDAWLYAPTSRPLITISEEAFRNLVKVISNTTSTFPSVGHRPICRMNNDFLRKADTPSIKPSWVELRHETLTPDATFDTTAPAARIGWQPYGDIERKAGTFRPTAVAGSPAAILQGIRLKSEEHDGTEEVIIDDIETEDPAEMEDET